MATLIQGTKFQALADYTYSDLTDLRRYVEWSTFDKHLIYCKTDNAQAMISQLGQFKDHKFVIVTHNSDGGICTPKVRSYDCDPNLTTWPDNIIKWFAQNLCINHPKITPIPIGLENDYCFPDLEKTKILKYIQNEYYHKINLVYVNHNVGTNFKERQPIYDLLAKEKWATVKYGRNPDNYADYLRDLKQHAFVVCPPGNGVDTHRLWEALYLGCIPIVKRYPGAEYFAARFPIILVDSWDNITQDKLTEWVHAIKIWHINCLVNYLDFNYWASLIREALCSKA